MKVTSYGKSMYGGWYLDFFVEGQGPGGNHFKTLKELKSFVVENNLQLHHYLRFDNI